MSEPTPEPTIPADHLPSLLSASVDPCVILRHANDELTIVGGNDQWADMSGTPMRELMRRTPATCMSADLHALISRRVSDGLPGKVVALETDEAHQVGENPVSVCLLALAPIKDQQFVVVTARPIVTDDEPTLTDRIVDAMGEALLVVDRRLAIVQANPAASRLLGFRQERLIGVDVRALATDDSMTQLTSHLAATSTTPATTRLELRTSDGPVEFETTTALIREPEPQVVFTLHDLADQKAHEANLAGLSALDALTGLANRDALLEHLRTLAADPGHDSDELTVAFCDIDNFKTINDALGHDQGDVVLETIGRRLEHALGEGPLVARFGGDEFVVVVSAPAGTGHEALGTTLANAFADPVELNGKEFQITASIGVISTDDADEMGPDRILKAADIAMYEAKRRGKDCLVVYDEPLAHRASERIEIESDLRQAVEFDQLVLHYQPIMDVISGRCVGSEALVRWVHPERGMVRPDEFIPIAEETGLIVPIGAWVLETAIAQTAEWNKHRLTRRALGISVNLSGLQLGDPDLERRIQAALSRNGFDPERLTLEITESMLMDDAAETMATLERLRDMGVRIAIDDFGTGYSSLAYLKRLPAKALKIDKAFIDGLGVMNEDTSLVTGIIGLASALGLELVAEGVETERQLKELRRLGCEFSQGYHHSKPLPAEDFERWLNGDAADDVSPPTPLNTVAPTGLNTVAPTGLDSTVAEAADDPDSDTGALFDQDAGTAAFGA